MKIILKMVFQADPVNDQKRSAEKAVSETRWGIGTSFVWHTKISGNIDKEV
jgi:hypothetical protein